MPNSYVKINSIYLSVLLLLSEFEKIADGTIIAVHVVICLFTKLFQNIRVFAIKFVIKYSQYFVIIYEKLNYFNLSWNSVQWRIEQP